MALGKRGVVEARTWACRPEFVDPFGFRVLVQRRGETVARTRWHGSALNAIGETLRLLDRMDRARADRNA